MSLCVEITDLNFSYDNSNYLFKNFNLTLLENKCYVLSGLNGCGKSTLIKLIAGKMLAKFDTIKVFKKDPFRDTIVSKDIAYVNNEWGTKTVAYTGYNIPIQSSIKVKEMMVKLKLTYPKRNNELISVLDINEEWSLNLISEGQRKRVQLYLALIQPFKLCLLDEITVNLDIIIKDRLLCYLKKECIENNACVVYITHIFDGLENWCTDLIYLKNNPVVCEMISINDILNKDIYLFILKKCKSDEKNIKKKEEPCFLTKKNAGGYTNGVLIDFNYDKLN